MGYNGPWFPTIYSDKCDGCAKLENRAALNSVQTEFSNLKKKKP